jgi:hypothetical protein
MVLEDVHVEATHFKDQNKSEAYLGHALNLQEVTEASTDSEVCLQVCNNILN